MFVSWVGWSATPPVFAIGALGYGGASLIFGHGAFRAMENVAGRRRLLAGFTVGYAVGAVLGLLFMLALPVLGVVVAGRTIDSPQTPPWNDETDAEAESS